MEEGERRKGERKVAANIGYFILTPIFGRLRMTYTTLTGEIRVISLFRFKARESFPRYIHYGQDYRIKAGAIEKNTRGVKRGIEISERDAHTRWCTRRFVAAATRQAGQDSDWFANIISGIAVINLPRSREENVRVRIMRGSRAAARYCERIKSVFEKDTANLCV